MFGVGLFSFRPPLVLIVEAALIPQSERVSRAIDLDRADARARAIAGDKSGAIPIVIATATLVDRGSYWEQLSMKASDIDLRRAPLPLIVNHDPKELPIGVVENIRVSGGVLRGDVKLANTTKAQEARSLIVERVARHVSVGYIVGNGREAGVADGKPIYEFSFEPLEVSVATIPADPEAQFYRSLDAMADSLEKPEKQDRNTLKLAAAAERERTKEVLEAGEALANRGGREIASRVLIDGGDIHDFNKAMLEHMGERGQSIAGSPFMDLTTGQNRAPGFVRGNREYSLSRLIAGMNPNNRIDNRFELEHSEELARQHGGAKANRILIPLAGLQQRTVTKAAAASSLIGVENHAEQFVDVFRPFAPYIQWLRVLSGLQGDVIIPRKTASTTVGWIAGDDGDSLGAGNATFSPITMSPKTVGALSKISHKMLLQSDAENLVREDLAGALMQEIGRVIISGSGASNQPKGIVNQSGIGSYQYMPPGGFLPGPPSYSDLVKLEKMLADIGALGAGNFAYLMTPSDAAILKQYPQGVDVGGSLSPTARFGWEPGRDPSQPMMGLCNGYPGAMTTHIPNTGIIFANWSDVILGTWGAIQLELNPYSETDWARGTVSCRILWDVDVAVRTAQSIAYAHP